MTDTVSPTPAAAPERLLRIQEVAADTGLTPRAIRYYEELGLLAPAARSDGAYRLYDAEDLERLRFIRGLRDDAGFSLAEIGQLLEDEQARTRNRQSFRSTADVAERRAIVLDNIGRIDRQVGDPAAQDRAPRGDDRRGRGPPRASRRPPRRHRRGPRAQPRPGGPPEACPMIREPAGGAPRSSGFAFANGGRAFRHRNYRLFFGGQLVSLVGTWMQQVAQAWLVLELTSDPLDPRPDARRSRSCPCSCSGCSAA